MEASTLNTIVGLGAMLVVLGVLYSPVVRKARLWTITVTPLASIIGSGFLIIAPLLYHNFGNLAVPAIILINVFALSVGAAIRNNIAHFDERQSEWVERYALLGLIERGSNIALAVSYVISIAFYVTLLSAFSLETLSRHNPLAVKIVTTVVLGLIGGIGFFKGLHGLEALEKIAVNVKMSIIGGLLLVLLLFNLDGGNNGVALTTPLLSLTSFQLLGGMLLITQGFETTKYLGGFYEVKPRIDAMLLAQCIAMVVYILFVWWVAPLVINVEANSETAIIAVVARLAVALGLALSIGAIFSQFSAAVADTVGTGGIIQEETRGRFAVRKTYLFVAIAAIILNWVFDIFSVLALASRAFAAYYGLQCMIATMVVWHQPASTARTVKLIGFPILAVLLGLITLFAIPAE